MALESKRNAIPHDAVPKDNFYIGVAEGGAAVVLNSSPSNIQGCYTAGLATCSGIVVNGQKGFVLIHDTGVIAITSLQEVCSSVGFVKSVDFFYNPKFQKETTNQEFDKRFIEIFFSINEMQLKNGHEEIPPENMNVSEIMNGSLLVTRTFKEEGSQEIFFDTKTIPIRCECPGGQNTRSRINNLRGHFYDPVWGMPLENVIPIDVHYDGVRFYPPPQLDKTLSMLELVVSNIQTHLREESFVNSKKAAQRYQKLQTFLAKKDMIERHPFAELSSEALLDIESTTAENASVPAPPLALFADEAKLISTVNTPVAPTSMAALLTTVGRGGPLHGSPAPKEVVLHASSTPQIKQ